MPLTDEGEPTDPHETLELFEKYNGKPGQGDTDISVLRHSAGKLGLDIGSDGYVPVCQIAGSCHRALPSMSLYTPSR